MENDVVLDIKGVHHWFGSNHVLYDVEAHMQASFGHLMGYGAKYYGYLWSKVFALDLFEHVKRGGLLNPEVGKRFVALVLGRGGSEEPGKLLEDFLGRPPNQEAFLKDFGFVSEETG